MITAEQARKNVELNKVKADEAKRQKAESFINEVVEPRIVEASVNGKSDIKVNISAYLEARTEIMDMIHKAGFETGRGHNDSTIRISWPAPCVATPHNTRAVVIIH